MELDLHPGDLVDGRYLIETLIGKGGMAEVYRVRHAHLDTQHALKVLTLGGRSLQGRLMQEGRVQAALRHRNIVAVTDVVNVEGSLGLVMEYVQGPPMDEFLAGHRLTMDQVDAVAVGILDGVAAAHKLELIHRDLKPANVMLDISGDGLIPKVADFGLVKLIAEDPEGGAFASKTRSGAAMGTPAYMAPEQIRDAKSVDERADVWSLGLILWEMVVGARCFDGPDVLELMVKVAGGVRPPLREVAPDLPDRVVNAIEAALVVDRAQRVGSVAQLRALWLDGRAVPTDPWDPETLALARSMGSGGEEAGDFLRRSFRSQERFGGTRPTAVPVLKSSELDTVQQKPEGDAATFYDEAQVAGITLGPESAPAGVPGPALAPVSTTPTAPSASPGPRSAIVALGLLGLLLVATTGALALGGLAYVSGTAVVVEPSPSPAPVPTPAPSADPAPAPAPVAAPDPAPEPTPAPAPEGTDVAQPTPKPAPTPAATPIPAPEPAGIAEPAPEPVVSAVSVAIDSDVSVTLSDSSGRPVAPADVRPGTYKIVAFFQDRQAEDAGTLTLAAGQSASIKCVRSAHKCIVKVTP